MVCCRFCYTVNAHFGEKKDLLTILADRKIYLIKVVETHRFSGMPRNLCKPLEKNNFLQEKVLLSQKI